MMAVLWLDLVVGVIVMVHAAHDGRDGLGSLAFVAAHGDGDGKDALMDIMMVADEKTVNLIHQPQRLRRGAIPPGDGHCMRMPKVGTREGAPDDPMPAFSSVFPSPNHSSIYNR